MTRTRSLLVATLGAALAASTLTGTPAVAAAAHVPLSDCANPDNGRPVIRSLELGTHEVDVSREAAVVPVTVVADDTGGPGAASGVDAVQVLLRRDGSTGAAGGAGAQLTRQPDGRTWSGSVLLPPGRDAGTWTASVTVRDGAGLAVDADAEELQALGADPTVTVVSRPDTEAPLLRSFTVSSTRVDSRRHSRRVTFTARATDDLSGLARVILGVDRRRTALSLVSGTRRAGTWRGSVLVPRWAGVHTWGLHVHLVDRSDQSRSVSRTGLARRGLPSALRVVGRSDTTRPTVSTQQVSPAYLDVRTEDGSLRVSVRARDALSGVETVLASIEREYGTYLNVPLRRVSGTRHDGLWAATVPFDHCQDGYRPFSGYTSMSFSVRAYDAASQWRDLPGSAQKPFAVEFRDNAWPTYNARADLAGIDVHLSEHVVANGSWDPSVTNESTGAEVSGTWTCLDTAGAAVDCAANALVAARFTAAAPLAPATRYAVQLNREHTLHVVDLAGNPVVGQEYDPVTPAS